MRNIKKQVSDVKVNIFSSIYRRDLLTNILVKVRLYFICEISFVSLVFSLEFPSNNLEKSFLDFQVTQLKTLNQEQIFKLHLEHLFCRQWSLYAVILLVYAIPPGVSWEQQQQHWREQTRKISRKCQDSMRDSEPEQPEQRPRRRARLRMLWCNSSEDILQNHHIPLSECLS